MAENFEEHYANDALAYMERGGFGLLQLAGPELRLPPAPLLRLFSLTAGHPERENLFFRNDGHPAIEARLRQSHIQDGYREILRSLARADVDGGRHVKTSFWALARAETFFSSVYAPFSSHEERATGFLLGAIVGELAAAARLRRECCQDREAATLLEMILFDTATKGNETHTGADIGIVVRSGSVDRTLVKSARVQVKIGKCRTGRLMFRFSNNVPSRLREKFEIARSPGDSVTLSDEENQQSWEMAHARLKFHQFERLKTTPRLGYYAVLDVRDGSNGYGSTMPPIVVPADCMNNTGDGQGSANALAPELGGIPLSAFLSLALTSPNSGWGLTDRKRGRVGDDRLVFEAIDKLFRGGTPPAYGLFVDVSAKPFGRDFVKRIFRRKAISSSEPPESAWPHFDDEGDPNLPDDLKPGRTSFDLGSSKGR